MPDNKYGMNPRSYAFFEKVAATKIRYLVIIFPVAFAVSNIALNDWTILDNVRAGYIDINSLQNKIFPFEDGQTYLLIMRIAWGLMAATVGYIVFVLMARHIRDTRGVSLE